MEGIASAEISLSGLSDDLQPAPGSPVPGFSPVGLEEGPPPEGVTDIQVARFSPLIASAPPAAEPNSLDLLLDVPLYVTVELGRARLPVRDLLALQTGSVIELDRIAGQTVDVLVNDRLVAHGEVVVIDDRFGVRITDIVSPTKQVEPI